MGDGAGVEGQVQDDARCKIQTLGGYEASRSLNMKLKNPIEHSVQRQCLDGQQMLAGEVMNEEAHTAQTASFAEWSVLSPQQLLYLTGE